MDFILLILLIIVWFIYYGTKGVIIHNNKSSNKIFFIVIVIVDLLALIIVSNLNNGFIKVFLLIYFIYSFSEYLFNNVIKQKGNKKNIKFPEIPYMSKIEIKSDDVHINYRLFKPFFLVFINLYLLYKKQPMIGFDDEFSLEVNSKDGTNVDLKF